MTRLIRLAALVLALSLTLPAAAAAAPRAQAAPVVRAVLFYSPTCPHCHDVLQYDLPPLLRTYSPGFRLYQHPADALEWPFLALLTGGQLEVLLVNASTEEGGALFNAAIGAFNVPDTRIGVPALVVGSTYLVGGVEIPERFPGLIESGLQADGTDWPAIPGLTEQLAFVVGQIPPPAAPADAPTATAEPPLVPPTLPAQPGVIERVLRDPVGNGLAIVVLIVMLASAVAVGLRLRRPAPADPPRLSAVIPLLAVAGTAIAFYLTYVETTGDLAACGPVGDCNAVQQSPYAYLFGVIPVGLLGLAGYLAILAAWAGARLLQGRAGDWAAAGLFALAGFGTLFSIGLTFLEPFVIGATCMWCIGSALIMTALLWLTADPGLAALARLDGAAQSTADAA